MIAQAKRALKSLLGLFVAEYRVNWIVAASEAITDEASRPVLVETEAHRVAFASSQTPKIRNSVSFADAGLAGMVLEDDHGRPVCVAHFADEAQYDRNTTWPLGQNEVALMDIATEECERGKGHAGMLIRAATRYYLAAGKCRLIAFIWWNNTPSVRAFRKAGWRRIGIAIEIRRNSRWRGLRCRLG